MARYGRRRYRAEKGLRKWLFWAYESTLDFVENAYEFLAAHLWWNRYWWERIALIVVGIVLALGLESLATHGTRWVEAQPGFCRSCHLLEPYFRYYDGMQGEELDLLKRKRPERLEAEANIDLSLHHAGEEVMCIDCHADADWLGRNFSLMRGTGHLVAYIMGTVTLPLKARPIPDQRCKRCHKMENYTNRGPADRYHYHWGHVNLSPPNTCVACHPGHEPLRHEESLTRRRQRVCRNCHEGIFLNK
jgi:hypothetical protein